MKTSKLLISAFLVAVMLWTCWSEKPVHLYMIGDSTMANKPLQDNPERGWGQLFPEYFKSNVQIHNHARNGRSTKSFRDQGLWQAVMDSLRPGDYVMIQFGHNDQKISDSTRYADPQVAYRMNLMRYVNESREKGAIPILLTPVMRRRFDKDGKFYDAHGEYPDVVRQVADSLNVPLIDMHQSSRRLIEKLGIERSKEIFLWVKPGISARFPDGIEDNTHFNEEGARQMAGLVVADLKKMNLPLKKWLRD